MLVALPGNVGDGQALSVTRLGYFRPSPRPLYGGLERLSFKI